MLDKATDLPALPEPSIQLAGFPVCAHYPCEYEVAEKRQSCAIHGGPPPSFSILRRTIVRKVRTAVHQILLCPECTEKDLKGIRCLTCALMRGQAMGLAQIAEQCGWGSDTDPLLAMICPSWASIGKGGFGREVG